MQLVVFSIIPIIVLSPPPLSSASPEAAAPPKGVPTAVPFGAAAAPGSEAPLLPQQHGGPATALLPMKDANRQVANFPSKVMIARELSREKYSQV